MTKNAERKNVLMVCLSFPPAYSGAAQALIKLGKGLHELGWRVAVVCARAGNAPAYEVYEGLEVYRLPAGRFENMLDLPSPQMRLRFSAGCAYFILRHGRRFGVVHFHGVGLVSLPGLFASVLMRLQTVGKITELSDDSPSAHSKRRHGSILLKALGFINAFIAISPRIAEDIKNAGCWPNSKLYQIPNPIDIRQHAPATEEERRRIRKSLSFDDDESVFLFVGAVCRRKGIDTLADAWEQVSKRTCRKVKLVIIGPPWEAEAVELIQGGKAVVLVGRKTPEELKNYYNGSDVFVLPTRSEGLPNVVLEAMSYGLPCVIGRLKGITDYLIEDDRGMLVEPGDSENLAKAMLFLLDNPSKSRQMGMNARHWVVDNANVVSVSKRYDEIYKNLMKGE